jgi:hypothetical protein
MWRLRRENSQALLLSERDSSDKETPSLFPVETATVRSRARTRTQLSDSWLRRTGLCDAHVLLKHAPRAGVHTTRTSSHVGLSQSVITANFFCFNCCSDVHSRVMTQRRNLQKFASSSTQYFTHLIDQSNFDSNQTPEGRGRLPSYCLPVQWKLFQWKSKMRGYVTSHDSIFDSV